VRVTSLLALIVACLLVVNATTSVASVDYTPVSCDGFVLGYLGPVQQKKCATGEEIRGQVTSKLSQIEITNRLFYLIANYHVYLIANYHEGEYRTYFPTHTPRQLLGWSKSFSQISNWRSLPDTQGFSVGAFNAMLDGKAVSCTIFVRYAGNTTSHAEYPGGPGYKTVLEGYYCPTDGLDTAAPGKNAALDDVLGKLPLSQP
jgi:hypothetical protein